MREYVIGHTKRDADYVATKLDINPVYAVSLESVKRGFLRGRGQRIRYFITEWATPNIDMETAQQLRHAELIGATVIYLARDPR